MVRVDDPDRVFDVSRPGRSSPDPTSRPLVVGHRPQAADPMVHDHDDPYADYGSEKKVTPVPVTWDESEENGPPPAANDFGGNDSNEFMPKNHADAAGGEKMAEINDSHTAQEAESSPFAPQNHAVATEPEVETKTTGHDPLPPSETLFAPDSHADKSSWSGDGHPPVNALPLGHAAGAGPRRSVKKIVAWLAALLVLAGAGAYLAIDAGLVGAGVKLPYEFFKEKETTQTVTTPAPKPKTTVKELPTKELPAFTLTSDWTEHEIKTADLKLAYPKTWTLESTSELGTEDRIMSSPDFKQLGEEGQSPFEGGRFIVAVKQTSKQLDDYKVGDQSFKPENTIKLDGIEGVFGTCNGTNACTYVPYLKREYFFAYDQSTTEEIKSKTGKDPVAPKDKYLEDFLKLLASVQFTQDIDG